MERFSTYYDIKVQNMENSLSIFHLLQIWLILSTYYAIKGVNMENNGSVTLHVVSPAFAGFIINT